jgi:GAF domain-containing protein
MSESLAPASQLAALEQTIAQLGEQQTQARRTLRALAAISLSSRSRASARALFEAIYPELCALFDADACYIAVCDIRRPGRFRSALMVDEGVTSYEEDTEYGAITGAIVRDRQPVLYGDLARDRGLPAVPFGNTEKLSRSWLGVPLLLDEHAVGVISVQSYRPNQYDAASVELLQQVGSIVAVALENVNLIEQQRTLSDELAAQVALRTEELAVLSAISTEMVLQNELPVLIDRALGRVLELLELNSGNVRLLDEARENLLLMAQRGFSETYTQVTAVSQLATSPIRSVVTENRPMVISSGLGSLPGRAVLRMFEAVVSVPLRIGERVIGTLSLFSAQARFFSPRTIDLVQAIGNQIAIAIENSRLFAERERQVAELTSLSNIAHAASTALDLPTLLHRVYDALRGFMTLDAFSMVVYDAERQLIIDGLTIDEGREYEYWVSQPPPPDSLTAMVLRTQQVARYRNLAEELSGDAPVRQHVVGAARPAVSWLGAPLIARNGDSIGVIAVQSYMADAFSKRDEQFLDSVAQQVSLHTQNVRLLIRRERQIRELDAIGRISHYVSATFDLNEMLRQIYVSLQQVTGASSFFLIICGADTYAVTHAFFIDGGEESDYKLPEGRPPPGSLTHWILANGEPLLFGDLPAQHDMLLQLGVMPRQYGSNTQPRSWAAVPLLDQSARPIGVIALQDERPFQYDRQTLEFLGQVAAHLSLGIQKVQLFEQRERQIDENARLFAEAQAHAEAAELQARRLELVNRIAVAVGSRLDQQEMLDLAARELVSLFDGDHAGIVLFDEAERYGVILAEYPATVATEYRMPLVGNPIIEELGATHRPVLIESLAEDPRAVLVREALQAMGVVSLVVVPLLNRGRLIGSIGIDSMGKARRFDDDEQRMLMTVATAIAAAVENARLFAAEQEARRTADTLREVARVLSATFDPREVLEMILRELHKVILYDTAEVMLLEGRELRVVAMSGWAFTPPRVSFSLDERNAAGMVVQQRRPVIIEDVEQSAEWTAISGITHVRSWLGVPLIARGSVLGVLNIDSRRPNRFSMRDAEVALAFANQAAVAIENALLYEESVTRVEQELEIAHRIQSNLFPRTLPTVAGFRLAARCIPARETGGDFYDCILLEADSENGDGAVEPRLAVMVGDASGKSIPGAMLMAVARSVARSEARDHVLPPDVMRETNRWIVADVPRGAFVALSYATLDPQRMQLSLANAGQLAPILRRVGGELRYLEPPGPTLPLGIVPDLAYAAFDVELAAGDTLVFYTDGVVEAKRPDGELFGFERLEALIRDAGDTAPDLLIDRVLDVIHAFTETTVQHDDMTLVVLRVE